MRLWDQERTERLRLFWGMGHTGTSCAKLIGDGITRNAVLGRVHRLNLGRKKKEPREPKPEPKKRKPKIVTIPKLAIVPDVPLPQDTGGPEPIGPLNTSAAIGACQYIHGDVAVPGWRMCGWPVEPNFPWCPYHRRRCLAR